jgi:catechol 2,3-dioxygenase
MIPLPPPPPARPYGLPPRGTPLPPETRLGPVRLQVAELSRSLAFYGEVLGLQLLEAEGDRATLGASGGSGPLVILEARAGAQPVPRQGRLGLFHLALLLPGREDLGRFVMHLARGGIPVGASDHGVSEALYLQDPDGLGIEVYADRPPTLWEHRDGELVMTTEPLDLSGLARAGGGHAWEGMPPGTRMGHVHLRVGALAPAEAFYHQALGFDKVVWSYPGALFFSAGGYHHHLGVNQWAPRAEPAVEGHARLLEWELQLPTPDAVLEVAQRLRDQGHPVEPTPDGVRTRDPWGTALHLRGMSTSEL